MSLSEEEIADIEVSLREIEEGKSKRFTNVKDLLRELKE